MTEPREELIRRFVTDVWNAGHEATAYDVVAADCPGLGVSGPEGTLAWHRERRVAFPDLRYKLVDVVVAGDRAAVHWRAAGTQLGQFGPVPPTGKAIASDYVYVMQFKVEKIAHMTKIWNDTIALKQAGWI